MNPDVTKAAIISCPPFKTIKDENRKKRR